ncbi:hypothetical protein GCM10020255_059510 [Rhodococcus baikonurensis]
MVDVVVKTMTITCERREKVDFSTQYFSAEQRIQVLQGSPVRGIDDLAGKRVCAARGTTSATRIQQLQPEATVVTVPMWSDCLVVLQQGQVDAISTDDTILAGLASQDPYLMMVGGSLGVEPYGIGVNKDNSDLVRFVNGTLDRIRTDGTWNRIYDRWLSVLGPSPGPRRPSTGIEADMTEETGPEPDATQASMRPEPDATQAVHREPDSTQAVHREPDSTQASVRPEPEATGAYERLEPTSAQLRGTTPSASSSPTGRSTRSRRSRSGRKLRLGGGLVEVPRPADRPGVGGDE